jgi:hypothetical protein
MRSDRAQISTCQDKTTDGCSSLAFRLPRGTRERQKQSQKSGRPRPTIHLEPNLAAVKVTSACSRAELHVRIWAGRDGVTNVAETIQSDEDGRRGYICVFVCGWWLCALNGCRSVSEFDRKRTSGTEAVHTAQQHHTAQRNPFIASHRNECMLHKQHQRPDDTSTGQVQLGRRASTMQAQRFS